MFLVVIVVVVVVVVMSNLVISVRQLSVKEIILMRYSEVVSR